MKRQKFHEDWKVRTPDGETLRPVSLPHDCMITEARSGESPGGTNTGWFMAGDYVYEKRFPRPEGKRSFLYFEGVYKDAEVSLNGVSLAKACYGYLPFSVELTSHLQDDNVVRVAVHNSDQPNARWYTGTGIYRPVWLYSGGESCIPIHQVKITTLACEPPRIQVDCPLEGSWRAEIWDGNELLQAQEGPGGKRFTLQNALLWSPEQPKLYTYRIFYGDDSEEVSFGIRQVSCSSRTGLCINGKRVILRGACVHHDNGILGACAYDYAEERKIRLLKEAGYNAIRSAHNPCSEAMLDACDRLGMLVVDEYVDMWYIHKTRYDYAEHFGENWKADVKNLIERDYNHPSVIAWSMGNEVSETATKKGISLSGEMVSYCHSLDHTRPVTCGINIFFNFLSSMGLGVYSDKKAAQTAGAKKKAVGSEFFNRLAGIMGAGFMKSGAAFYGSDVKTRDAFARFDIAGYNYGIRRYKKDLKKYPDRVILGSETFCFDSYEFMELAKKHPALIGDFVWSGMDYLGEVGLGAMEYREYAPDFSHGAGWIAAGVGMLDLTGKATSQSDYTRVVFGRKEIAIGVVPVSGAGQKHSPSCWRMTNAIASWSWEKFEGNKTEVLVYSLAPKVELVLNGRSLGTKKTRKGIARFSGVIYENGELLAYGLDAAGKRIAKTALRTASSETVLLALPEEKEIRKRDLCYVRLQYTDKNGVLKPACRGDIRVTAEGGEVLATGSACPYYEGRYGDAVTDTYYGEALAVIRPVGDEIIVHADSRYGEAEAKIAVIAE